MILAISLLLSGAASAQTPETLRASPFFVGPVQAKFVRTPAFISPEPALEPQPEPLIQDTEVVPLGPMERAGAAVGRMSLSAQLDRHRSLVRVQLGASAWDVGIAGDAAFKTPYLTFTQGDRLLMAPVGDLRRLIGEGVEIEIERGVVYKFKLNLSWTNPVRNSTMQLRPARGTHGPSHDLNTGALVDAVRSKSFVFSSDGTEYWTLYGSDVDPAAGTLSGTRSLVFIKFDGMKSKAWPAAESSLPEGQPVRVQLVAPVVLQRAGDQLLISSGR